MNLEIKEIKASEIIDSRGMPTVKAKVEFKGGIYGCASVPSGASTGSYEACELRDCDKQRYLGKGVLKAVGNVNTTIKKEVISLGTSRQRIIDQKMISLDGTKNKSKLGANATLSVSLALAHANAKAQNVPLYRYIGGICASKMPIPMMNILNGGAHAGNNIDIQEFMIVPIGFNTFKDALRAGCEIYASLKKILKARGLDTSVGDEGGFAPNLNNESEAIELIIDAINDANYDTESVKIALDIASSEWYKDGNYKQEKSGKIYTSEALIDKWDGLVNSYPIISLEDPLSEDDYTGWEKLTKRLGEKVMLVGDDLFVTNEKRLQKGINLGIANAILIKPNQIGTLTETLDVIALAKQRGYQTIISHRSGETDDTSIADIAVGTNAGFIKTGAPCRMDRVAKYNRLLEIEEEIYIG